MPATETEPTEQPEQAPTTESAADGHDGSTPDTQVDPDSAQQVTNFEVDRESLQQVINNFYAPLYAGGQPDGAASGAQRRTGRLSEVDIDTASAHYMPPMGYDDAVRALLSDHVVVLAGPRGAGKRAGAIALLREVTGKPLFMLSPALSLKDLAQRTYEPGCGYVVIGRDDNDREVDAEFNWHTVRDRVRDCDPQAWLVVTTEDIGNRTSDVVTRIPWQQPDPCGLITSWLDTGAVDAPATVDAVARALPDEYTMTDLVGVLRTIAAGADIDRAVREFDLVSQDEVRQWFEQEGGCTRRQILEVTAVAFLGGCNERTIESLLGRLEELLAVAMPVPEPEDDAPQQWAADVLPQRRHAMAGPGSLISIERAGPDSGYRHVVDFRAGAYRRAVLAELWARMEVAYWDAVKAWLHEIVESDLYAFITGPAVRAAGGLAELAAVAIEEVSESFLQPWSTGDRGWAGRTAATYVLWSMCYDEALAPVALRTAVRWATIGNRGQRSTATIAFSGVLGTSYPTEAVKRLWQLLIQAADEEVADTCWALAALFAALTEGESDAGSVLTKLDWQWREYRDRSPSRQERSRLLAATVEVLSVREARTGRCALFSHLHRRPDRIDVAARLWSAAMCHRPTRRRVLDALLTGLRDLTFLTDQPEATAGALGSALAGALPVYEHAPLAHDLTTRQAQRPRAADPAAQQREATVESLVRTLLGPLTLPTADQEK